MYIETVDINIVNNAMRDGGAANVGRAALRMYKPRGWRRRKPAGAAGERERDFVRKRR